MNSDEKEDSSSLDLLDQNILVEGTCMPHNVKFGFAEEW